MYTRCPYCHTYFKVQAEHLKKAGGKVRCGQCFKVFNSIGNLLEKLPVPLSEKKQTEKARIEPEIPKNSASTNDVVHNTMAAENFAQQQQQQQQQQRTAKPSTPVQDGPKLRSSNSDKAKFSAKESIESIILSKNDKIDGLHTGLHSPTKDLIVHPTLGIQDDDGTQHNNPLLWGLGLLIMLSIFVLQYSYFFRADLALHPEIKPWIENLCDLADCEIPAKHDIRAIKLTRRDITTHPKVDNALLISAAIVNEADQTQPFPVMRVRLSDTIGQIIASRKFNPQDYLDADVDLRRGMPAKNPIQINLEIIDPGKNAINFEFDFFYPRTN